MLKDALSEHERKQEQKIDNLTSKVSKNEAEIMKSNEIIGKLESETNN